MTSLNPKRKAEQLLGSVDHQKILKDVARSAVESALGGTPAGQPAGAVGPAPAAGATQRSGRLASPLRKAAKPGLVAAGAIAGVTAVSAVVSSVRKRGESE